MTQAGEFGDHIGRVEIDGDRITARVEPIAADVEPWAGVADEARLIEHEVEAMLAERIAVLERPLDARYIAEILRERMGAEIGLCSEGLTCDIVPPGPLTFGRLCEASEVGANPGVTRMSGRQLLDVLARAAAPAFAAETPGPLRGRSRGRLELAGIDEAELEPERIYRVAASDWELEPYGGYTRKEWSLAVSYDFPVIVREAIEEHLRAII